jgi:hypothetical protein
MNELIEVIRTAVAEGATTEQKAVGVQACRTIAAALDTEPGKPLVLPGVSPVQTTSRVSIDQVLDLMIARLSLVAKESETHPPPMPTQSTAAGSTPVASRGLQLPPLATANALRAAPRPATARQVQSKARPATNAAGTGKRTS